MLSALELDEYLAVIRAAGLVPEATEDVSDHTRPSWGKAAEKFEAAREPAEQHIGAQQFDLTISRLRRLSEVPTVGYALLTARKPA
jgi:hypothetical protein